MEKKKIKGTVVSTKMEKTAVVSVPFEKMHPVYKKRYVRQRKFKADNSMGAKEGDSVEMVETRPLSKDKCWRVVNIL